MIGKSLTVVMSLITTLSFGQNWNEVIKATASDRGQGDNFGISVAISGNYAIVGAFFEDQDTSGANSLSESGSAYIFENVSGTWIFQQKIVASDRAQGARFGVSVAISGDYAIVGADSEDKDSSGANAIASAGAAYIFKNNAGTWTEVQKIVATDRSITDYFGVSVAISGDFAIVGAYQEDEDATGSNTENKAGSAYIFKNTGGTWSQMQKIVASDRSTFDWFGHRVGISGDYAIVGTYLESEDASGANTMSESGSAYLFEQNAGTWTEVQKIVASDRAAGDRFGISVSLSNNHAIVGAYQEDQDASGSNALSGAGAAYIFENNAGTWSETQKIVPSDRDAGDQFGWSVSISGNYAIVSAHFEGEDSAGNNTLSEAGSAYIFKNNGSSWIEEQKVVASDRDAGDRLGSWVAISDDHAIVGAYLEGEDSPSPGGSQLNSAGAAYIFKNNAINGILESSALNEIIIFPNPSNGNFSIDLGTNFESVEISISNIAGEIIQSKSFGHVQLINLSIKEPSGVYFLNVKAGNKEASIKLIKE